jgi:phosphoribosylformylglycinamidine synthase
VNLDGVSPEVGARHDLLLFGEAPTRVVVSVAPEVTAAVQSLCSGAGVPCTAIGTVGGDSLRVLAGAEQLHLPLTALYDAYDNGLPRALGVD